MLSGKKRRLAQYENMLEMNEYLKYGVLRICTSRSSSEFSETLWPSQSGELLACNKLMCSNITCMYHFYTHTRT
jgi:hypothetical protein